MNFWFDRGTEEKEKQRIEEKERRNDDKDLDGLGSDANKKKLKASDVYSDDSGSDSDSGSEYSASGDAKTAGQDAKKSYGSDKRRQQRSSSSSSNASSSDVCWNTLVFKSLFTSNNGLLMETMRLLLLNLNRGYVITAHTIILLFASLIMSLKVQPIRSLRPSEVLGMQIFFFWSSSLSLFLLHLWNLVFSFCLCIFVFCFFWVFESCSIFFPKIS